MDEQARLLAQAAAYNQGFKPKSKGNLFTNSLSTAGGILGGIGGSFLAPGLGTAAGGAAGAGAGKWLENLLEGNDASEGVLGEAALGTLGGIGKGIGAIRGATGALRAGEGTKRAGDILRFGTQASAKAAQAGVPSTTALRTGRGLEDVGAKMLASQGQLTGAQARSMRINPTQAFSNINKRTGLTNIDDMAEVSRGLTGGKDSMLDILTREAVGSTKGVTVPDLRKTASTLLDDVGSIIPDEQRKRLLQNATRAGAAMRGGSKGSLSELADPQRALDTANSFRTTARNLTNKFTSTPEQQQLAKTYDALASTIEGSIYKAPGVNQSIPVLTKAGADDLLFRAQDLAAAGNKTQAKAYEKIALELRDVKDVAQLRKMKKDFVDLGKIDEATAQAQGARTISGADTASSLRNPFNIFGMLLDKATPAVGGAVAGAGRAAQAGASGGNILSSLSQPVKIAGTQLAGRALTGTLPTAGKALADQQPTIDPVTGQPLSTGGLPGDVGTLSELGGTTDTTQQPQSIYTKEAVAQDIQNDLQATGGANMEKYITLYNFLNPEGDTKANATTQKALSQSANADATLGQLQGILQQAGGAGGPVGGSISSFFGGLGLNNNAKTYNDLASGSVTQIAKALGETGAMSDADRVAYANLIPKITDTPEVAAAKFAALQDRMATAKANTLQYGAGDGIAEALAAGGY